MTLPCGLPDWSGAIFLGSLLALATAAADSQSSTIPALTAPPVAPIRPITEEYFGVTVTDPYRYIENLKDPNVGYTSSAKLGGEGTSAGGITIGRTITERPDLFAAVLDSVGVSNALRGEETPNGPPNIPEFGTVKDHWGFEDLYAMDAYQHVRDGVHYPAVLLTTGWNDPRVASWEPGKMTARLQAASKSGKEVLLRVDYAGGHGMGSTKEQQEEETADKWSFLLWQFGEPGFQPGGPAAAQK
jgi:protease II